MTVSELIEILRDLDMPDAEVQILTNDSKPNPALSDVYYSETQGPVILEAK